MEFSPDQIGQAVAKATQATEYCLFYAQWWPLCMSRAEWAAWLQAVFSVIAIAAAVYVPWKQHKMALRQRDEAEVEQRARTIFALALTLRFAHENAIAFEGRLKHSLSFGGLPDSYEFSAFSEGVSALIRAAERLDLSHMGTRCQVELLQNGVATLNALRVISESLRQSCYPNLVRERLGDLHSELLKAIRALKTQFDGCQRNLPDSLKLKEIGSGTTI